MKTVHRTQLLADYLQETLGVTLTYVVEPPNSLPLAHHLKERYRVSRAKLLGRDVLVVFDDAREQKSPTVVRKHLDQIGEKAQSPLIYVRPGVSAYDRKRLIAQRIPFIVPGNQMFLPDLGIDLREHFRAQSAARAHLRPAAQALLIHVLLRPPATPPATSELARELGYTSMTITRAFHELRAAQLAHTTTEAREQALHLDLPPRDLWRKALPSLRSPVVARHFIKPADRGLLGKFAGYSALAAYSTLADPPSHTFAMQRKEWLSLESRASILVHPEPDPDDYEIQSWSYPPVPFRVPDHVDPLSLYLSLKDSPDERTQHALNQLLENLPW